MNSQNISASPQSVWLTIARIVQVAIICLTIGLFIVSVPINYEQRRIVCRTEPCPPSQLTSASEQALIRIGMSADSLAAMTIALDILVAVAFTACAIVIFIRKPNDILTIFVTIMLVTFGAATFTGAIRGFTVAYPQLRWLFETISLIGNGAILAFFFVFPNGRFTPPWTIFIFVGYILFELPRYYLPDSPLNLAATHPLLYNVLFVGANLAGLASQIYRYRRVSKPVEKQQTKWVVYGVSIAVGGYMTLRGFSFMIPDPNGSGLPVMLVISVLAILLILLLPLSISIAVIRYRLWDINPIINRTLVYGALSASTMVRGPRWSSSVSAIWLSCVCPAVKPSRIGGPARRRRHGSWS